MAFPPIEILREREPPQASGHRDHKRPHRDKLSQPFTGDDGRGLVYLPPLLKPNRLFAHSHSQKFVRFPVGKNRCVAKHDTPVFPASRTSRYNTLHLCSKGRVPKGYPLETLVLSERSHTSQFCCAPRPPKLQKGRVLPSGDPAVMLSLFVAPSAPQPRRICDCLCGSIPNGDKHNFLKLCLFRVE